MSTPELKPETPDAAEFIAVATNHQETVERLRQGHARHDASESDSLRDKMTKLESALNAAREAIENAPHTEGCWQNAIHQADETSGPLKCTCWKAEALAQISPQQSKTT